jgi:hypothetical protein
LEAVAWIQEAEGKISGGKSVDAVLVDATTTYGKPLLRSKAYNLDKLK